MKIVIPDHRGISWNTLYAQRHWTARKRIADSIHELVVVYLPPDCQVYDKPVHLTVTATYRTRPVDPDNICAKLYIDALKGCVIVDDTLQYVSSVTLISRKGNEDSVEIEAKE